MNNEFYVWLGTKRAVKKETGAKAANVDYAKKLGLPVPMGIVILDEFFHAAIADGLILEENDRYHPTDAQTLYTILDEVQFNKPVAVRSAFSAEDQANSAMAGFFTSHLNIDANSPTQFIDALCDVWSSANRFDGDLRRDVLIMEMVEPVYAGVAFTESGHEDDLVNFTSGTADKLVSGDVAGGSVRLPKLRSGESSFLPKTVDDIDANTLKRVQFLLRGVRRVFDRDGTEWDIEWADDGDTCWLIQARPITQAPRRNEAFTFANIKEILPDLPSTLQASVTEAAASGLFEYYRAFDKTLPENRQFVELFYGRPLFNMSLLTDMMRHWGLPTALVTNSIGGESDVSTGMNWLRFFSKTFVLLKVGWAQLTAVSSAKKSTVRIMTRASNAGTTFTDVTDSFIWLFTNFVSEMLNLTQAMSGSLLILRNTDTLNAHSRDHQSISTDMFTDMRPMQALVDKNDAWRDDLENGRLPSDPTFQTAWETYLDKHGHRGIYESDIARPRFRENPTPMLQAIAQPSREKSADPQTNSLSFYVTKPLWWHLRRILGTREQWRYDAMKAYEHIRTAYVALAESAVSRNQLPTVDHLWQLSADEVKRLDDGWTPTAEFWQKREKEIERLSAVSIPDLIHRFDDLEADEADLDTVNRLKGISLTSGTVEGKAWVLKEPSTVLPDGFDPATTILVARSIDAGWIPTFSKVAGVAVETGGDLSHGSIILREIGIPAITNVTKLMRHLNTGEHVTLEADHGILRKE